MTPPPPPIVSGVIIAKTPPHVTPSSPPIMSGINIASTPPPIVTGVDITKTPPPIAPLSITPPPIAAPVLSPIPGVPQPQIDATVLQSRPTKVEIVILDGALKKQHFPLAIPSPITGLKPAAKPGE